MKKMVLLVLPVLVLAMAVFVAPAFAQAPGTPNAVKVYDVGDMAPDFKLYEGLTSELVVLNDILEGEQAKVIALTFMNTTCSACQAEVALLSKLADKHDGALKVYLIAVDVRGQKLVKSYNEYYKYNVSYLLDPRFTVPPAYGFSYTPALVLIDNEGKILYKKGGYTPADADALIKTLADML
jgi:thiol-disulfide isomerase/thioredoxin